MDKLVILVLMMILLVGSVEVASTNVQSPPSGSTQAVSFQRASNAESSPPVNVVTSTSATTSTGSNLKFYKIITSEGHVAVIPFDKRPSQGVSFYYGTKQYTVKEIIGDNNFLDGNGGIYIAGQPTGHSIEAALVSAAQFVGGNILIGDTSNPTHTITIEQPNPASPGNTNMIIRTKDTVEIQQVIQSGQAKVATIPLDLYNQYLNGKDYVVGQNNNVEVQDGDSKINVGYSVDPFSGDGIVSSATYTVTETSNSLSTAIDTVTTINYVGGVVVTSDKDHNVIVAVGDEEISLGRIPDPTTGDRKKLDQYLKESSGFSVKGEIGNKYVQIDRKRQSRERGFTRFGGSSFFGTGFEDEVQSSTITQGNDAHSIEYSKDFQVERIDHYRGSKTIGRTVAVDDDQILSFISRTFGAEITDGYEEVVFDDRDGSDRLVRFNPEKMVFATNSPYGEQVNGNDFYIDIRQSGTSGITDADRVVFYDRTGLKSGQLPEMKNGVPFDPTTNTQLPKSDIIKLGDKYYNADDFEQDDKGEFKRGRGGGLILKTDSKGEELGGSEKPPKGAEAAFQELENREDREFGSFNQKFAFGTRFGRAQLLRGARAGTVLSNLLIDDDALESWHNGVDKIFNNVILGGSDYHTSQLCKKYVKKIPSNVGMIETPGGQLLPAVSVNAERQTVVIPGNTTFTYKLEFFVEIPESVLDESDQVIRRRVLEDQGIGAPQPQEGSRFLNDQGRSRTRVEEFLASGPFFNVLLFPDTGDPVFLFQDSGTGERLDKPVKEGARFAQRNLIVRESSNLFNRICVGFFRGNGAPQAIKFANREKSQFCKEIQETITVAGQPTFLAPGGGPPVSAKAPKQGIESDSTPSGESVVGRI